jgi:hypothetical protein
MQDIEAGLTKVGILCSVMLSMIMIPISLSFDVRETKISYHRVRALCLFGQSAALLAQCRWRSRLLGDARSLDLQ